MEHLRANAPEIFPKLLSLKAIGTVNSLASRSVYLLF